MATTFIEGIAVRPGRTQLTTAKDSIEYITNPEKTDGGRLVTAFRCSPEAAHFEIMMQQHEFEQKTGRKVIQQYKNGNQSYMLMTMRQSFAPGEVTPEQAHEIGCKLAERFLGDKYQYVVATHINSHCIHNHITFNIVGSDFKKFRQTKYTPKYLRQFSDRLCEEYNLTVVVPSQEWQKRKYTNERVTPFREILKSDIDHAIEFSRDFDEFLKLMEENYRLDDNGKYLKFRHRTNGQQRYIRSYSLGSAYTKQNIRARISGRYVPLEQKQNERVIPDQPITYSQHLRNIQSMVAADQFVTEYGSNFEKQVQVLCNQADEVQAQMKEARSQIDQAVNILKCFDAIEQYGTTEKEYETALLKEHFAQTHREELEVYSSASALLKQHNIDPATTSRDTFTSNVLELQEQLEQLQIQYNFVQSQIKNINKVKRTIERVQDGEQIISDRKRGKNYGR